MKNLPVITISCSFTRSWSIDQWIKNLLEIDYPKGFINLACIVDIDDPWIATKLGKIAEKYRDFKIIINRDWNPNEVRPIERRKRIAFIKNQSKDLIKQLDGEFVFGLEDDTVFNKLDISKFLIKFADEKCGTVEGVQCGRWHCKMIGAWKIDNIEEPKEIITLLPKEGYERIDAGGFYGYLISKENYLKIPYEYNGEPWGPDVNAGLWLRRKGFTNWIDWSMKFGHNLYGNIMWPDTDLMRYKFMNREGTWLPVNP